MRHEAFFSKIDDIGELYLEYIFFDFELEPLLFTCVDKDNNLYFCHCYKLLCEQKWFVIPVSFDLLTDLVEEKKDIRSVILLSEQIFDITRDVTGKEICMQKNSSDILKEDLPAVGVFLKCDKEKAKAYINEREHRFKASYDYAVNIQSNLNMRIGGRRILRQKF